MSEFVQLCFNGLALGARYALVALGFVIIYRATGVINFAQGSLVLLGAYVIGRLHEPIGFWPAVAAGIVASALAASCSRSSAPPRSGRGSSARYCAGWSASRCSR